MPLPEAMGCPVQVPPHEVIARGLFVEGSHSLNIEKIPPELAARMRTAHAPFGFDEKAPPRAGRMNIAALDPVWRRESLLKYEEYLASAARFPAVKLIVMHPAPRLWREGGTGAAPTPAGEYSLLIEGLRKLAGIAAKLNMTIAVENNRAYWDAVPDAQRFVEADRTQVREYFGTSPWDWLQIWRDVARDNVGLCLDTSHATTYSHRFDDLDERRKVLWTYLSEPRALRHIHWNDNDPWQVAGRDDRHLAVGSSGLGDEFNRAIRGLKGVTHLLEHFEDLKTLDRELAYIGAL